jgi:hypothetical protein
MPAFQIRFSIPNDAAYTLSNKLNIPPSKLEKLLAEDAKQAIIKKYSIKV